MSVRLLFRLVVWFLVILPIFGAPAESGERPRDICRLNEPLNAGALRQRSGITTIVLHHTAVLSLGNSLATLRLRGMSYHYLIDDDGTIVKAVPVGRTALHAAGANRGSIGIAFTGGTNASWSPTVEQWASAKALIANLVKDYRSIHYLVGHGDVRDTNAGEPYNVSFDRMIAELQSESHVALRHPTSDEPPLEAFRRAAVYLLEHPRVPRRVTRPEALRKFETLTCSEGKVRRVPVTLNGIP